MSITLLQLDNDTVINTSKIVQVTLVNLNKLRRERGQHHETPEQRERMKGRYWEVSIYIRSDNDGYNPQRYTKRFHTEQEAQNWIQQKLGGSIVTNI